MTIKNYSTYPSRQPFPKTLVVSLEGKSEVDVLPTSERLSTFELNPFSVAKQQVGKYLESYRPTRRGEGTALGIKGSHGSGKTHLIRYLMQVGRLSDHIMPFGYKPVQVYIKVESNDLWTVYRQIIAQIDYETLREVNAKWLEQISFAYASKAEMTSTAVKGLAANPDGGDKYFLNVGLLFPEVIEENLRQAVLDMTYSQDFFQALYYLRDPLLGRDAYRWLRGDKLSDHTLRKLGIEDSLNKEDIDAALRFLVTLFGRARRPLLLYIDQIERLLRNTALDVRLAHVGILKSLAENFVREQGMLCLAGARDAWGEFSKDFFARLRMLELPTLSVNEALNLLKLYLTARDATEEFKPYSNQQEIYPYTEAAVREMVRLAHGNTRALLHLAYHTFEEAFADKALITAQEVKDVFGSLQQEFSSQMIFSEDGQPKSDYETLHPPAEAFDLQPFLANLSRRFKKAFLLESSVDTFK